MKDLADRWSADRQAFKESISCLMVVSRWLSRAASTYGYEVNEKYDKIFNEYHKTHNQAVFDAYTDEMKVARHTPYRYRSSRYLWSWTYRRRLQKSCSDTVSIS